MTMLEEIWPVFGLRVEAGPVELSGICDDDIPLLVDLASGGIHEPGAMPFALPWSTAPDLGHEMAAYYWRTRAEFSPKAWTLDLLVRNEGIVVGCQGFHTRDFLVTRTGETGSWLGPVYQGRGIGTLMRQAICVTLLDHLGCVPRQPGARVSSQSRSNSFCGPTTWCVRRIPYTSRAQPPSDS